MPATLSLPRTRGNFPLIRLLDIVGDGSGSTDMSLNFLTPTIFKIAPPKGTIFYMTEIAITFVASGGITPAGYGSGLALSNGIQFVLLTNNQSIVIPQLATIKTNFELVLTTNRVGEINFQGNDRGFKGVLNFAQLGLDPIQLNGNNSDQFSAELEDDFTTRVATGEQTVTIYGSAFTN